VILLSELLTYMQRRQPQMSRHQGDALREVPEKAEELPGRQMRSRLLKPVQQMLALVYEREQWREPPSSQKPHWAPGQCLARKGGTRLADDNDCTVRV
jgi:hypothetical protein